MKIMKFLPYIFLVLICGFLGGLLGARGGSPQERTFEIKARKFAFEPNVIRVNKGDKITFKLISEDVTHGFYLEGYDFDAKVRAETPGFWIRHPSKSKKYDKDRVDSYTFVANRIGKFRYRCSINCGSMHPFMQGEMIVEPNYLFPGAIGLAIGIGFACIVYFQRERE